MRKDIKALLANIIKYTVIPVVVTWIACVISFRKDPNSQTPTNLEKSENMVLHDSSDDTEDWVMSDTSRIADSALVIYDRKYDVTTLLIEGLLDDNGLKACKKIIVDEEQIDHILVSSWSFSPKYVEQTKKLNDFMSTYKENIMEESNSFMLIR